MIEAPRRKPNLKCEFCGTVWVVESLREFCEDKCLEAS